jgi:hypothetical protein
MKKARAQQRAFLSHHMRGRKSLKNKRLSGAHFSVPATLFGVSNLLSSLKFVDGMSYDPLVLIPCLTRWLRSLGFQVAPETPIFLRVSLLIPNLCLAQRSGL